MFLDNNNSSLREQAPPPKTIYETYHFELLDNVKFWTPLIESSNKTSKQLYPVFVLLVSGRSILSGAIKKVSGSIFSHSSISLNSSMTEIYSFGSKKMGEQNIHNMGFTKESILDPYYKDNDIKYAIYTTFFTKQQLDLIKQRLDYFIKNESKFKYDFTGLVRNFFHIDKNPEYSWFCSRFVADILNAGSSEQVKFEKPSLVRPSDFTNLPFIYYVCGGTTNFYDKNQVDKITKKIMSKEKIRRNKVNKSENANLLFFD